MFKDDGNLITLTQREGLLLDHHLQITEFDVFEHGGPTEEENADIYLLPL